MRFRAPILLFFFLASLIWPSEIFAKRAAPKPVPPVDWKGLEFRVDHHDMGVVEAFDQTTGNLVWKTKLYTVLIIPLSEEDVQWVFILKMSIQNGKLFVTNERGRTFYLNPLDGTTDGSVPHWILWTIVIVIISVFIVALVGVLNAVVFRRVRLNESMGKIYQQFGEAYHPVGRLRWFWIMLRSVPMLLLFSLIATLYFLYCLPIAIWSLVVGKRSKMIDATISLDGGGRNDNPKE